jgi:phosphopantothenoylcysteine decarboxylase/phosphopantothenate--cysteine ligase
MGTLDGKRILLIISGGIAAYKSLELIRLIKKSGGAVRCILTAGGAQFVTPLSVAALSGEACYTDLFSLKDEAEMGHIRLSREADLVVVAPASANMIARMAHGLADDLASTALLASDKPVLIAPAMNVEMWAKPAVQANVSTLRGWGIGLIGPAAGDLACGETGDGRMAEPEEILAAIVMLVAKASPNPLQRRGLQGGEAANASPISSLSSEEGRGEAYQPLSGLKALVTGGPTYEPLDPVRYIGNRSSGKQGRAMAAALAELGAAVTLVTGPVALADGEGFKTVHVETALEMLAACRAHLPVDIAVCTAAVSDWSPAAFSAQKIKKNGRRAPPDIKLKENPDILATLARPYTGRPKLVVGFAAETKDVVQTAAAKRQAKNCDWIIANDVTEGAFGTDDNRVWFIDGDMQEDWGRTAKQDIARKLASRIAERFTAAPERAKDNIRKMKK